MKPKLPLFLFSYLGLLFFVVLFSACSKKDSEALNTYYLYCSEDDFNNIYENWQEEKYISAELKFEGKTYKNLKLRLRGDTSKELPKKSLKLKPDDGALLPGGKTALNLNAEYTDKSMVRSAVSGRLFQKSGHPCFNSQFAQVYLNDEFLGLYLEIENMDEQFLQRNGFEPTGNLFKATKDGACLSLFDQIEEKWENKTSRKNGFSQLKQLIHDVNTVADADFHHFVKQQFDYNSLINLLAMNMYLANGSTYYHNYYLFHDSGKSGKWFVFPWDLDKTIHYYHWKPYVYHETSSDWESDNALVERCLLDEQIILDIKARLEFIHESLFTEKAINEIFDPVAAAIEPVLLADTTHQIKSITEWKAQINKEKLFLLTHKDVLIHQMDTYPKPFKLHASTSTVVSQTTLCWEPSMSNESEKLTYTVRYGNHFLLPDSTSFIIENISDTCLLISNLEPNQTYYWRVSAHAGDLKTDGFNTKSLFKTATGTILKEPISKDIILTQKNSPYLVEGVLKISKSATLRVQPGVELLFKQNSGIEVEGGFVLEGTHELPIKMMPQNLGDYWGDLVFSTSDSVVIMKHVILHEGRISASNCELLIEHCQFKIDKKPLTFTDTEIPLRWSWIWIKDCVINFKHNRMESNNSGEGLNFFDSKCQVENNYIENAPDAIEFIGCKNSRIAGNVVYKSSDDAIDMNNCHFVTVENNILLSTKDKAISIGSEQYGYSENIKVQQNFIRGAKDGVGVKDSSFAEINNNLFIDCNTGIRLYQKSGKYITGGQAICTDNAFVRCEKKHTRDDFSRAEGNFGFELNEDCDLSKFIPFDFHLAPDCFSENSHSSALNWDSYFGVKVDYLESDSFCGISISNNWPIAVSLGGYALVQNSEVLFHFPEFQSLPTNSTLRIGKCKKGCTQSKVLYYREPTLCQLGDKEVQLVKVVD